MKRLKHPLLIGLGLVSLGLGVVGIVMPLVPTVPFVLFAAWCFVRSSTRLHDWLMSHSVLGEIVRNYAAGRGVRMRAKIAALISVWLSLAFSASVLFFRLGAEPAWFGMCAMLLTGATSGTWYLLTRIPTLRDGLETEAG